jgi:NADH:ubiquinone oxidoreductase subunit 2 (subunit N)
MAKYWLLYALADRGSDYYSLYWVLIVIAVLNTLISLFYYFRVAQQMFLTDDQSAPISTPVSGLALVNACAVALLLTGFLVVAPIRRTTDSYARNLFRPRLPYESAVVAPPTDRGVAAR